MRKGTEAWEAAREEAAAAIEAERRRRKSLKP